MCIAAEACAPTVIGVAFNLLASQSVAGYRGGDILYVDTNHIQLINNKYNVLIVLIIDNCTIGVNT